jgi:hypothetical protein
MFGISFVDALLDSATEVRQNTFIESEAAKNGYVTWRCGLPYLRAARNVVIIDWIEALPLARGLKSSRLTGLQIRLTVVLTTHYRG